MTKTKIISLIMILAMLLSAFSMLGVSAESAELKFSGATLSIDSDITVYFMVAKEALAEYDCFFATFEVSEKETTTSDYFTYTYESVNYYMIPCYDVAAKQINDTITANIYGVKDGNETKGAELEYSVATYCYNRLNAQDSSENMKKLAADLLTYGSAAQTKFNYNTENLANAAMTETHKAYVSAIDVNSLTSCKESIALDGAASVAIIGATMELGNRIRTVFVLNGAIDGTTAKLKWDGGEQTVEAADYVDYSDSKLVYFDAVDPADYAKVLTVTVYNGETAVSNTVKYSMESYAIEMNSEIALAVLGYCKSAENYIDGNSCQSSHTWISEADIDNSYNVTMNAKCTVCGETKTVTGKGYSSTKLYNMSSKSNNYDANATYKSSYDSVQNAWKQTFSSGGSDAYFMIKNLADSNEPEAGNKHIPYDGSPYVVARVKGSGTIKIKPTKGDEATVTLTNEWQNVVIHAKNTSSYDYMRSIKFYLSGKDATVYVNSIAVFESKSDAEIYAGAFGHTYADTSCEISETYDLNETTVCSICGNTQEISGKGLSASQIYELKGNSSYGNHDNDGVLNDGTYDYMRYVVDNNPDPYRFIKSSNTQISLDTYKYMVVYYKSNAEFKLGVNGDTNCKRYVASATDGEWTAAIFNLNLESGNLGSIRVDFAASAGNGKYYDINSIAFFKTEAEARAFAGIGLN